VIFAELGLKGVIVAVNYYTLTQRENKLIRDSGPSFRRDSVADTESQTASIFCCCANETRTRCSRHM